MKRRLTPKTIDALPPAVNKRYEVHDQLLPGLHLRVPATRGKVFYVSKRINGRMKPKQRTKDWKGSERVLLKFSSLFSRPIDQIKRADAVRVLDTIIAGGGASSRPNHLQCKEYFGSGGGI